ncbi:TRIC cation channel family protein [Allochromatium palmeri]|uniref:Transporter substrate-binding domain-containing protein n=1 Tax=Allochromatium palmeri TaxID=231048 RepID=A0A6N8EIC4_9GAMM|nr:TRIC cation channel family protein [Allochromatium palmeri]MTW22798.1 transporter substrate-binding domain-containing protein [Allochromatium palmeri]
MPPFLPQLSSVVRTTIQLSVLASIALGWTTSALAAAPQEFRGGWSPNAPYQYETIDGGGDPRLSGYDIEVAKAVASRAGLRLSFEEHPSEQTLQFVQEGLLDFALAATSEESRRDWAWFTVPYRLEKIGLLTRWGDVSRWAANTPLASLRRLLEDGGRVALIRGFYYGPEVAALRRDERFLQQQQWLEVEQETDLIDALLSLQVEGVLADPHSAVSAVARVDALGKINGVPGSLYEAPLCFLLSKKSVSKEQAAAFNQALIDLKTSGHLEQISRHYLLPQLLSVTTQTAWFRAFDIIGTIAFAISGVLIARREKYDLIGACVLAALPAVGGGVLRDLISGRSPIGIVESPSLLLIVFGTVLCGLVFFTLQDWFFKGRAPSGNSSSDEKMFRWRSSRGMLELCDAIGLATFTIVGVVVAIQQRCEPLWLWGPVMAGLTAAGGGVLRDVLRSQADIPTLKGTIYPVGLWTKTRSFPVPSRPS